MKVITLILPMVFLFHCSCSTTFKNQEQSAKSLPQRSLARVQAHWQTRFETFLREAGAGSEGWALFSDGPMGHTGQQLVIVDPKGAAKLCFVHQTEDDCTLTPLGADKLDKLLKVTQKSDGLADRAVQSFDTINSEYVHIKNLSGNLTPVSRVFFMADVRPLPADYQEMIQTFTTLNH